MAQVDRENPDEVERFADRWTVNDERIDADKMAHLCGIVHRTLYELATQKKVPADCLLWFNRHAQTTTNQLEINDDLPKYEEGESLARHGTEPLSLDDLVWRSRGPKRHSWVAYAVQHELSDVLTACLRSGGVFPVRLCAECQNPMVGSDGKQTFCSTRCANRNSTRRRRASSKIEGSSHANVHF